MLPGELNLKKLRDLYLGLHFARFHGEEREYRAVLDQLQVYDLPH